MGNDDTKTVELPPDQAQRIVSRKMSGGSYLLLSVSDNLPLGKGTSYNDFSPYSKVHIFAESIAFSGDLLSPHGISLLCNDITMVNPVKINATGVPGADQSKDGTSEAKDGDNGGLINFYVQSGSDYVSKHLSFETKGGKGGDAVIEQAQAGNGGAGGHSIRVFQSCYSTLLDGVYGFLNREDASEKKSSSSLHTTDPIYLSALKLHTVALKAMIADKTTADRIKALGELLSKTAEGTAYTVNDLVIKVRFIRNSVENLAGSQKSVLGTTVSFKGGYGGSGEGVYAKTGTQGKDGSDTPLCLSAFGPDVREVTFAFAHPEQCAMLLDRAKVFYYMGSPVLRITAEILFQRLVHRLHFLPVKDTDPLAKAYNESTIMPPSSLSKLESIKTDAANWLTQLATGVCFNGRLPNWSPRASYTFYKDALDTALADHAAFENAYIKYHTALSQNQKLKDSIGLALQQMSQMIGRLQKDIDDLVKEIQEIENNIASLTEPVKSTHAALQKAFDDVKNKIKNEFDLSVPQIMNALTFLAFSPCKGMLGIEGIDLVYQGFSSVPDLNGTPANRDLVIHKIQHGEATVKSIKDTLGKELDGTFKLEDPLGTRLMTAEDDMMNFLEAYAHSSFADVMDKMKEKFDAFVKAIIARNEKVVLYNLRLKLYVNKTESKNDYEQKQKDLKDKDIDANDPNLPSITAYMNDIYQLSRARVMQLLDNLVRSLNFRMLTSYDIFKLAFEGTNPEDVPLTITSAVLLSGRSRIQNEFGKIVEIWGSEPARFPQNFDNLTGKRIYLSENERKKLIKDRRIVVKIPVMYKNTKTKNDFSGCCNVRIYRVRFGLTGLAAKEKARVTVTCRHSGGETIVDRKNLGRRFVHDSIVSVYSFNLDTDGKADVLDNGNIGEVDVNATATNYAAPGPFADDWTVDLKNSELVKLDFSKVTEAYFDFCGTNYAFP